MEDRQTVTSNTGIEKLPFRTRRDDTTAAVRHEILNGSLPSGSRLKDIDLAASLGVSRATVREALRQLVYEGILIEEPYKGLVVASFDESAMRDLADVRVAIETLAAQRLAKRLDADLKRTLEAQLNRIDVAGADRDADAINDAHFAFHGLVHSLSGVPILSQMWEVIGGRTRLALRIDFNSQPEFRRISRDHREMVAAIYSKKDGEISRFVAGHIQAGATAVLSSRPSSSAEKRRSRSSG
jgi:DNA-binding GntR family transcriptional regulator